METQQLILTPEQAHKVESQYRIIKRSIDARQHELKVHLTVCAPSEELRYEKPVYQDVHHASKSVHIVGAGPAGLFAALTLLEHGIKPIVFERGKTVSERKKDIALLNRNEGLNPESNYCFGEGGAGTFSDGKLFSRSKKRGNMQRVMEIFHYFGAPDSVLYEAHAHIGSDKLPTIIKAMRECILSHGGEIRFCEKWSLSPLNCSAESASCSSLAASSKLSTILAIGHSAHDTYRELYAAGVAMQAKGCAMGVRIEHPQSLINDIFYHHQPQSIIDLVGNASYSLVTQVNLQSSIFNLQSSIGVYSFCMCPGGHIVPAGSSPESCVVNGMSASHRNSPYANSGMVVELHPEGTAMDALDYQENLEHLAWLAVNQQSAISNHQSSSAPAQRMRDFVEGRHSATLPPCSYLPGIVSSRLDEWLPEPIRSGLQQGFRDFGRKYAGFLTNDAVILGVESRSSSPVRIVRDPETMQSVSHPWLYPCGEGAGYAGGITSSALDGINAALAIIKNGTI